MVKTGEKPDNCMDAGGQSRVHTQYKRILSPISTQYQQA